MKNRNANERRRQTFLILDPYDTYALEMARYARNSLGIRGVALFSDVRMRAFFAPRFPEIESELFEEKINLDGRDLTTVAVELSSRFEILGVAPYLEFHVEQFAPVVDALKLAWNSESILLRCRDKFAMKNFLRERGVDVPRSIVVHTADDAKRARTELGNFVLKPNAGYGNQNVGFFDQETDDDTLAAHLRDGGTYVAESYVDGQEYSVNGQVNHDGSIHSYAIIGGERTFANGRDRIYRFGWQLPKSDPAFDVITRYGRSVVEALQLRSIPFHAEMRLDKDGPKLIDFGARLIGNELGFIISALHGGALNPVHLAIRGYLGLDSTPPAYDWEHHDAKTFFRVDGISRRDEIIATLHGIEQTEARPEFYQWAKRPEIGQHVDVTLDLDTLPFVVDFLYPGTPQEARVLGAVVEKEIFWNHPPPTLAQRAAARQKNLSRRIKPRARFALTRLTARGAGKRSEGHVSEGGGNERLSSEVRKPQEKSGGEGSSLHSSSSPEVAHQDAPTSRAESIKRDIKEGLWPLLRHVVPRHSAPDVSRWGLQLDQGGRLEFEGVDVAALTETYGSPLYVVLDAELKKNANAFLSSTTGANVEIFFSYKTNPVPSVCARLHQLGIGAECISPYEFWLALELGTPPSDIVYGGPAKSQDSLERAIDLEIKLLNINHPEEIERVERAARKVGKKARVGIRVTPAGGWAGQFGVSISSGEARRTFERALSSNELDVIGLHVHRGMVMRSREDVDGYLDAVLPFATSLVRDLDVDLRYLDLGGSLAIPTVASFSSLERRLSQTFLAEQPAPDPRATLEISKYVQVVADAVHAAFVADNLDVPTVILEPGRALSGSAQLLLTSVVTTKEGERPPAHAVLDGGINIAEPAQFEYHRAICANRASDPHQKTWRLVGPACTPGDVVYSAWPGPHLEDGDVIAILDAGAYFVPFSTTFSFPRPAIVSIQDGRVRQLRRPETFDDLVQRDEMPRPRGRS